MARVAATQLARQCEVGAQVAGDSRSGCARHCASPTPDPCRPRRRATRRSAVQADGHSDGGGVHEADPLVALPRGRPLRPSGPGRRADSQQADSDKPLRGRRRLGTAEQIEHGCRGPGAEYDVGQQRMDRVAEPLPAQHRGPRSRAEHATNRRLDRFHSRRLVRRHPPAARSSPRSPEAARRNPFALLSSTAGATSRLLCPCLARHREGTGARQMVNREKVRSFSTPAPPIAEQREPGLGGSYTDVTHDRYGSGCQIQEQPS